MVYGYARCSTNESKQDIERQVRELKAAGCKKIYLEYEHGDSSVKKELENLFEAVREGDELKTTEITRLTRSTKQLCGLIDRIREKKIKLTVLNSISVDCRSGQIDPMTNAFLQISGVFAELEKAMTVERVKSGLANAKAKGMNLGRPHFSEDQIPPKFFRYYPAFKTGKMRKVDFARVCGVARTTLDRYIKFVEGNSVEGE